MDLSRLASRFLFAYKSVLSTETLAPRQKRQTIDGTDLFGDKMKKGSTINRKAICHPDRKHFCKGMCLECYRKKYDHARYEENKDEVKARTSQYAKDHPEICNERAKRYRDANPEKVSLRHKKYNKENSEKVAIRTKKYRENNSEKISEKNRKYYINNPEKERAKRLRRYGLTPDDYNAMYSAQNGLCAICGDDNKGKRLHVDHDHETGEVRQLLCNSCNIGIGMLKDNPSVLEQALNYLRKHKK